MVFGARYMRDMQKLSKDAERVYQASKPVKKPTILTDIPSQATSQASMHPPAPVMEAVSKPVEKMSSADVSTVNAHINPGVAADSPFAAVTEQSGAHPSQPSQPRYGSGLQKVRDTGSSASLESTSTTAGHASPPPMR